ncbi:MAG: PaaI family thioesterase [Siculibacillus sp.]|nr:PaaI family thioesterase [Siculibacillus sp.]
MSETKAAKARGAARPTSANVAALTSEEVTAFLEREFPQLVDDIGGLTVEDSSADHASMRLAVGRRHLRPGGTVSGPTQFFLADVCAFVAVLVAVGPVALAVTTSATINFLKKPAATDLLATARILKRGKRLVVVDCTMHSEGDEEPVAHAVLTYALPPK